jgi:hypothetical protein
MEVDEKHLILIDDDNFAGAGAGSGLPSGQNNSDCALAAGREMIHK